MAFLQTETKTVFPFTEEIFLKISPTQVLKTTSFHQTETYENQHLEEWREHQQLINNKSKD